jgi:hypothetical protein
LWDWEQELLKIVRARSRKGRYCLRTGRFRIRKGSFKIRNKSCRVENKKYWRYEEAEVGKEDFAWGQEDVGLRKENSRLGTKDLGRENLEKRRARSSWQEDLGQDRKSAGIRKGRNGIEEKEFRFGKESWDYEKRFRIKRERVPIRRSLIRRGRARIYEISSIDSWSLSGE